MKKRINKKIVCFFACVFCIGMLFGCGKKTETTDTTTENTQETVTTEETKEDTQEAVEAEPIKEEETQESLDDGYELLAVVMPTEYNNIYSEEDYEILLSEKCDTIVILNRGYDELQKALETQASDYLVSQQSTYKTAEDAINNGEFGYAGWAEESKIVIARADSGLLSYVRENYSYYGGPHPNFYFNCYNYDPKTGQQLFIWDVVKSSYWENEEFYNIVIDKLKSSDWVEGFNSDWEDTVAADFYGDGEIEFTLDYEKMKIIFNSYELGPYALGDVSIELPIDEYGYLINDQYIGKKSDLFCRSIDEYGNTCLETKFDADGDGSDEILQIDTDVVYDEEYGYVEYTNLIVSFGKSLDTLKTVTVEAGYSDTGIGNRVLMQAPNGKYYLYVDCLEENDYRVIHMFDVSDPTSGPVDMGFYYSEDSGAMYDSIPQDPENFYLFSRVEVMGSYDAYRFYEIGDDGIPVSKDDELRIVKYNYEGAFNPNVGSFNFDDFYVLTAKMDVECESFEDINDRSSLKADTIKAGEKVSAYATDGDTYIILFDENGKYYKITFDPKDEEVWYRTIDGINEENVFSGIIYAG